MIYSLHLHISSLTASCDFYFCKDLLIHLRNYSHFCAQFLCLLSIQLHCFGSSLHFHTVLCRIRHFIHRIIFDLRQIFVGVRRFSPTFVLLCVHTYQIFLDLGWFLQSSHPFGNRSVLLRSILALKLRLFPLNFVKYEIYDLFWSASVSPSKQLTCFLCNSAYYFYKDCFMC